MQCLHGHRFWVFVLCGNKINENNLLCITFIYVLINCCCLFYVQWKLFQNGSGRGQITSSSLRQRSRSSSRARSGHWTATKIIMVFVRNRKSALQQTTHGPLLRVAARVLSLHRVWFSHDQASNLPSRFYPDVVAFLENTTKHSPLIDKGYNACRTKNKLIIFSHPNSSMRFQVFIKVILITKNIKKIQMIFFSMQFELSEKVVRWLWSMLR